MRARSLIVVLIPLFLSLAAVGSEQSSPKPAAAAADESAVRPEPPYWASLVGSAERDKYHRLTCGIAQKIKPENVIWFGNANDATENGYVAAGCNDKKCRPPVPESSVQAGPIGGGGFPPPDLNPPEIPKPAAAPSAAAKTKKQAMQPKGAAARPNQPPPRMAPRATPVATATLSVWQDVPPQQELAARNKWDVWAEWALERWCERWHVSSSGKIASNAAYTPEAERHLMGRFKEMKAMISQNKKRLKELEAVIAGKKK